MKIEINNLTKKYNGKIVINNLNEIIDDGQRVALIGKSGSGKTTFINIILKVIKADEGDVIFSEEPYFSVVFQDNLLFENKTVYENLLFVKEIDKKEAEKVLESLGLYNIIDKKVSMLSGGMKRRVAIARSLVYNGNIYIFDEALRKVDFSTKELILNKINSIDKTIIFSTHNIEDIKYLKADKIIEF